MFFITAYNLGIHFCRSCCAVSLSWLIAVKACHDILVPTALPSLSSSSLCSAKVLVKRKLKDSLGLPLGLEAPVMTPNGVIFLFL